MEVIGFRELPLSSPHSKYFKLLAEFQPDDKFITILSKAIDIVVQSPGFTLRKVKQLQVLIPENNVFTMKCNNKNQYGSQFSVAVLYHNHMKELSDFQMLICCVEEFVHHFWNIQDEIKTSQIVSSLIPNLSCDENGKYIYLE